MKNIKTVKSKTTKAVAKVATVKAPAAVRAPRSTQPAPARKEPAKATAPAMTAPRREITSDLIAARAFILWEQQGRPQGHDVANWLLAEKQLKQEQSFTA